MKKAMKPQEIVLEHNTQDSKTKKSTVKSLFVLLTIIYLYNLSSLLPIKNVEAETVSNPNYFIDINNIDTNPQLTPRQPVVIKHITKIDNTTEFSYSIESAGDTFSFGISQNLLDYGILSSTNPIIRVSTVSLSGALLGSQLLGIENHPLLSSTNDSIQNTSCDNGACSPQVGALWDNTLTFGFGYRCDSSFQTACDPQFQPQDYYKTFPDQSRNQLSNTIVMQPAGVKTTHATLTYKVNISGTQKASGYYNSITYLAIPNF